MLRLRIVQAECGDCFILTFGLPATPHYILVDGGPESVYPAHLKGELARVGATGGKLDLIVLSHVDSDHITGLLDLLSDLREQQASNHPPSILANGLWHNTFGQTIGHGNDVESRIRAVCAKAAAANQFMDATENQIQSIADGQKLRTDALALRLPINAGFADGLVSLDSHPDPLEYGNLRVTVLGPTRKNLDSLRQEWLKWLQENEDAIGGPDPRTAVKADRSKPNVSSIMLLAEADGKRLLLTGDGRGDHLLQGIGQAGLLDSKGGFHVDVLKMPHHGSARNVTKEFLRAVTADHYVISANGMNDNPDLATLVWIVEAAKERQRRIILHATNMTPSLRNLFEQCAPGKYGYQVAIMDAGQHATELTLAE